MEMYHRGYRRACRRRRSGHRQCKPIRQGSIQYRRCNHMCHYARFSSLIAERVDINVRRTLGKFLVSWRARTGGRAVRSAGCFLRGPKRPGHKLRAQQRLGRNTWWKRRIGWRPRVGYSGLELAPVPCPRETPDGTCQMGDCQTIGQQCKGCRRLGLFNECMFRRELPHVWLLTVIMA
jgi:hypothetical protein